MTSAKPPIKVEECRAVKLVEVVHEGSDLWERVNESHDGALRHGHLIHVRSTGPVAGKSGLYRTLLDVDESVADAFLTSIGAPKNEHGEVAVRDWTDYEGAMSDCDEAVRQMIRLLNGQATREGTREWVRLNYPKLAAKMLDAEAAHE